MVYRVILILIITSLFILPFILYNSEYLAMERYGRENPDLLPGESPPTEPPPRPSQSPEFSKRPVD
jgi:hypothetical protein